MSFSTSRTIESFGEPATAAAISFTINSQFPIFRGEPMIPSRVFISATDPLEGKAVWHGPKNTVSTGRNRR